MVILIGISQRTLSFGTHGSASKDSVVTSATVILILILPISLVLGCFLEEFAMMVPTLPIFFPIIQELDINPIWFGGLLALTLQMGLISLPVCLTMCTVKPVAKDVPIGDILVEVVPFRLVMAACLGLLVAFPQTGLTLPNAMINR